MTVVRSCLNSLCKGEVSLSDVPSVLPPISVDLEGGDSADSIPSEVLGVKECVLVGTVPPPTVLHLEFSGVTIPEFHL